MLEKTNALEQQQMPCSIDVSHYLEASGRANTMCLAQYTYDLSISVCVLELLRASNKLLARMLLFEYTAL